MAKVRDVMTTIMVNVDSSMTVLGAVKKMQERGVTGVAVIQNGKPVGMVTDRSLFRWFIPMNKKPEDVHISEILMPILKIDADAQAKDAARKLIQNRFTRLGVFEKDKMIGWVALSDLGRETSKNSLIDHLHRRHEPEPDEILCPVCRSESLEKIEDRDGNIQRWECSKCGHVE
ncbi:MAG: CBS domain-containing protein [Candidatus Methylarchaceae archaeon HK01B]|nr:CBS domain-containing protein [Candidatus Methylarchaceae archaeon HK01B]